MIKILNIISKIELSDKEKEFVRKAIVPTEKHIIYMPNVAPQPLTWTEYDDDELRYDLRDFYMDIVEEGYCNINANVENLDYENDYTIETEYGSITFHRIIAGGDWEKILDGVVYYDNILDHFRVYFPVSVTPWNPFLMKPLGNEWDGDDEWLKPFWGHFTNDQDFWHHFKKELELVFIPLPKMHVVDIIQQYWNICRPLADIVVEFL